MGVVSARGGNTRWMDVRGTHDDALIARVGWTPDSRNVYVVRTNRVQNKLDLLLAAAASGKASGILEETDKYWVNVPEDPVFVNGGQQFLWLSERDGFRHMYSVFDRRQTIAAINSRLMGGDRDHRSR